ncbi:MAG: hypothetical protein OCC49_04320 [Fibrobacterales bacterium]
MIKRLSIITTILASFSFALPHHSTEEVIEQQRTNLVSTWIYNYAQDPVFEAWTENAKHSLRQITAGLYLFSNPQDFSPRDYSALSGLPPESALQLHKSTYQQRVLNYLNTASIFNTIGTSTSSTGQKVAQDGTNGGDYDFILKGILSLLYTFKDRPDILTPSMVSALLLQGTTDPLHLPYTGNDLSYTQVYLKDVFYYPTQQGPLPIHYDVKQPETENHMVLIYSWHYLINNYITWVASLDSSHPSYNETILTLYNQDPNHYENSEELSDLILQILGRVVHNGLFETNAKAYEAFTTNAILNLYSYSDETTATPMNRTIQTAALNALDYLSVKYAFQSLENKRIAPMRRNFGYKERLGYYQNDYMPHIWGALTGEYQFDDTNGSLYFPELPTSAERLPYHFSTAGQPAGFALWASLSDYRIPKATLAFMQSKNSGVWSKMQSQYTNRHYDVSFTFNIMAQPPEPADIAHRYFNDDKSVFMDGESRPVTELQFITDDYSNVSGGLYQQYNQYIVNLLGTTLDAAMLSDGFKQYDALAKPQTLILKGDNGYWNSDLTELSQTTLTLNKSGNEFWKNANAVTYKNFSMVSIPSSTNPETTRVFPESWQNALSHSYIFNTTSIQIYDFRYSEAHPLNGYYIIMGSRIAGDQQQVWWEVVPGNHYFSPWMLGWCTLISNYRTIAQTNSNDFTYSIAPSYERITISPDSTIEDCFSISRIRNYLGQEVDPVRFSHNSCTNQNSGRLIDVWEVDTQYQFTGVQYVRGEGGLIEIYNPAVPRNYQSVIIDSRDYTNPINSNNR